MAARLGSDWSRHAIWWHVYPLGAVGAETALAELGPDPQIRHRLPELIGWLDHLVSLGCNGLLLGPVLTSSTHGYDTLDHFVIDPRLGDDGDFDALIEACRARGVRVLLDGVFNHVGRDHPLVRAALADPAGPEARAVRAHEHDGVVSVDVFEGHDLLVELDHDADAVADLVRDVMLHWLERGIDGWRLDAAYAVPAGFWARVLPAVRARFPDAWFVGEMIHGDYAAYAHDSGVDSITQYELWKAIWSSLDEANLWELEWTLRRHRDLVDRGLVPLTFVGNHDVTRIASRIRDGRHLPHAIALLAFLPGVPSVYAGDELGLTGVKEDRVGGDDAVRPRLPADPARIEGADAAVLELHRRLLGVRRRFPWLVDAVLDASGLTNTSVTVTARPRSGDEPALLLTLNLADESIAAPAHRIAVEHDAASTSERIAPHGWAILSA